MTAVRRTFRLSKKARVRSRLEFAAVYDRGVRVGDDCLSLTVLRNDRPTTRLGLAVSKRCGNAVQRNRIKRRLREAFRLSSADLPTGLDLVVQPRAAVSAEREVLRRSLISLAKRAAKKLASADRTVPKAAPTVDDSASKGTR